MYFVSLLEQILWFFEYCDIEAGGNITLFARRTKVMGYYMLRKNRWQ